MARPVVSAFTEALYATLPEAYQLVDAPADYPLLRFLSLEGDAGGGAMQALLARLDPAQNGGVSALLDATQADAAWLPWIAQLRGVKLAGAQTLAQQRAAVAMAPGGWAAGTVPSIQAAAGTVLTGTKTVRVFPNSAVTMNDAGPYDMLILTRPEETPDPTKVLPAIIALGAKPAGIVLHYGQLLATYAHLRDVHGTYTALEATFPTYQKMTDHIPE